MKKIKDLHKYLIGITIGIVILGSISVYAVEAVIDSKEVSYDNKESHGRSEDVQGSIDELYERSGIMKSKWVDPILNGADPVFDDTKELIPVTITDDGTVSYANLYTKWYEYETKRWANAVILVDSEKGKYKTGDKIPESAIESYFVWIPRYKYKIWDLGDYTGTYVLSQIQDTEAAAESSSTALRRIASSTRLIDIVFQKKEEKTTNKEGECAPDPTSGGGKSCKVGNYMTHPAFTTLDVNGIWVGKFETGYKDAKTTAEAQKDVKDSSKIIIKPNVYSWRGISVGNIFKNALNYESSLGSHMMKNTEWGAVAYLSHSIYGIRTEVNINNNSAYLTGYSATANTDQSSYPGTYETDTNSITKSWNTSTGYLASTTGNITGVYDMSGGAWEYMAAYMDGKPGDSGFSLEELKNVNNTKYFDKYSPSSSVTSYNNRILGDATGEIGPFYVYFDKDGNQRYHNVWYADFSYFVDSSNPWFVRSGNYTRGVLAGQFYFGRDTGSVYEYIGSRLVLAVQ